VLLYFITFTPKSFVLAVAAISAELRAILLNKICKISQFLCRFVNSINDGQLCDGWLILHKIMCVQNAEF